MPRKSLKSVVELTVHAVTCPGVWLPFRDQIYLSCCILGQHRRTKLVEPIFPYLFHEKLRFEKTYYTAIDPSHIAELLEDEHVLFELIQVSDTRSGGILLATYENNSRDFLYPEPHLLPIYGLQDREVLMERTLDFPGISPKIEFATKTTIKETKMPHLDNSNEDDRSRRSPRRPRSRNRLPVYVDDLDRSYEQHTIASISRSRSPSPSMRQRLQDLSFSDSNDSKAPFVIRKRDESLIHRTPGSPPIKAQKFQKKKKRSPSLRSRSVSPSRRRRITEYCPHCLYPHTDRNCTVCSLYKQYTGKRYAGHSYHFHPTPHRHQSIKAVREPRAPARPIFESTHLDSYGDTEETDDDVLEMSVPSYSMGVRYPRPYSAPPYRPPSPIITRPSLQQRFDEFPRSSDRIRQHVDDTLRRSRSPSPINVRPLSPRLPTGYDSLDELEDTFRAARERSMVHLHNGEYWSQEASKYTGKPHRQMFYDNLDKLYTKMYHRARTEQFDDDTQDKIHYWND